MKFLLLALVTVYVVLVGRMYLNQRKLMYFPEPGAATPEMAHLEGFSNIRLEAADGTRLQAWHSPPAPGMPLVVYFHGNAGNLISRAETLRQFSALGMGILAVSYRGYGESEGTPTQHGIYADARAAIHYAVDTLKIPAKELVLYGESLGTGVAVKMASEFRVRALALQSPYRSVAARAQEIYWFVPVSLLITDKFESHRLLRKIHTPTIIFHGEQDQTITPAHGRAMLEAAQGAKEGHFFPHVGHVDFDTANVARLLLDFIQKHPAS